jgi:ankyrin repeat protein
MTLEDVLDVFDMNHNPQQPESTNENEDFHSKSDVLGHTFNSAKFETSIASASTATGNQSLPLAPSLRMYMTSGATRIYQPRPEWLWALPRTTKPHSMYSLFHGLPRIDLFSDTNTNAVHPLDLASVRRQDPVARRTDFARPPRIHPHREHFFNVPGDMWRGGEFASLSYASDDGEEDPRALSSSSQHHTDTVECDDDTSHANGSHHEQTAATQFSPDDVVTCSLLDKSSVFGKDWDSALHVCVREGANEAALALLEQGAPFETANLKGVTPLILASQKGNVDVTRALLQQGASPSWVALNGSTAVLQACHFGHLQVLDLLLHYGGLQLMEVANYNDTTPLMRAAQEGHLPIVRLLLRHGAQVSRRNRVQMTALMLAAQRGHADICRLLLHSGADVDASTHQHSTALLLATKRGHTEVVRALVEAGAEIWVKDSRGRTAQQIAQRKHWHELAQLLDGQMQIYLMQRMYRQQRSWEMARLYTLLQHERATVHVTGPPFNMNLLFGYEQPPKPVHPATLDRIPDLLERSDLPYSLTLPSTRALIRTMLLPAPIMATIAQYLPMPLLWHKRVLMLTKQSLDQPDVAVANALDIVDEILEEGGFLEACDRARIPPPNSDFENWKMWKMWIRTHGAPIRPQTGNAAQPRINITTAHLLPPPRIHASISSSATTVTTHSSSSSASSTAPNATHLTIVQLRHSAAYLSLLVQYPHLSHILQAPDMHMPLALIAQLRTVADVASVTRRTNHVVHWAPSAAVDLVLLLSRLCAWYDRSSAHPRLITATNATTAPLGWDESTGMDGLATALASVGPPFASMGF